MYNRYVRDAEGTYKRMIIQKAAQEPEPPADQKKPIPRNQTIVKPAPVPPAIETGDLLVLLVLLLILTESDECERTALLITIAAFLMIR